MQRTKLLLLALLLPVMALAGTSLKSRLIDVNNQWAYRLTDLSEVNDEPCILGETAIIQKHLFLVHELLSEKDVSRLSEEQKENRSKSLEHLLKYAQRGLFPQNITHEGRRPVFIDHRGVHCAVGYLIQQSGHSQLSNRISSNMNFYYLKDMEDGGLSEWVGKSGFSVDELAWIQPGYQLPVPWAEMKGGVNGSVHAIVPDGMGGVYAGGYFDTAGTMAATNFASWYFGLAGYDWFSPTPGPNGPVYTMLTHNNQLYVGGDFYAIDTINAGAPVAMRDGNNWTALGDFYIGALVNYVYDLEIYRDTLYAGGFFRSKFSAAEQFAGLAKWNGTEWVPATSDTLFGPGMGQVNTLHVHNGKLIVGGRFQLPDGTENIFAINGNTLETFAEDIPNEVHALATYEGDLYAGTDLLNQAQTDTAGLMSYQNNEWQQAVSFQWFAGNASEVAIRALLSTSKGLVFGGDFSKIGFGNSSDNIAAYKDGYTIAMGSLDSTVTTLYTENSMLYIGGHFTSGNIFQPVSLGHITSVDLNSIGTRELEINEVQVFPNPARSTLSVKLVSGEKLTQLQVFDLQGKEIKVPFRDFGNELELDVSRLPVGNYILKLEAGGAVLEEKLLIEN